MCGEGCYTPMHGAFQGHEILSCSSITASILGTCCGWRQPMQRACWERRATPRADCPGVCGSGRGRRASKCEARSEWTKAVVAKALKAPPTRAPVRRSLRTGRRTNWLWRACLEAGDARRLDEFFPVHLSQLSLSISGNTINYSPRVMHTPRSAPSAQSTLSVRPRSASGARGPGATAGRPTPGDETDARGDASVRGHAQQTLQLRDEPTGHALSTLLHTLRQARHRAHSQRDSARAAPCWSSTPNSTSPSLAPSAPVAAGAFCSYTSNFSKSSLVAPPFCR